MQRFRFNQELLTNAFVQRMQDAYNVQFPGIREAIQYYQILSLQDKRRFTNCWKELDRLIGKEPKGSKSYSFKFINEVIARQLFEIPRIRAQPQHQALKDEIDVNEISYIYLFDFSDM
ncbi:Hypothetical_protein [Hexamita inflata]|uniref:Hypothetical_protein n=1 Tax=Hexamita inflata TaxID=28002 RepID=A0ABP1I905_9EUKA